jgi:hypothetical protein
MRVIRNILWIDCFAAALGGMAVLAFSDWLSRLHELPNPVLIAIGLVSLFYAAYAFALARQSRRCVPLVVVLACANASWALVCLGLVAHFLGRISLWGMTHLIGEALFVASLAYLEWTHRHALAHRCDKGASADAR